MKSSCGGAPAALTAESAFAGNAEALQALRELITYPLLYSLASWFAALRPSWHREDKLGTSSRSRM